MKAPAIVAGVTPPATPRTAAPARAIADPLLDRIVVLLTEIATAANEADRACYFHQVEPEDREQVVLHQDRMRGAACLMGYIAETALLALGVEVGSMPRDGAAENWLICPTGRSTYGVAAEAGARHG